MPTPPSGSLAINTKKETRYDCNDIAEVDRLLTPFCHYAFARSSGFSTRRDVSRPTRNLVYSQKSALCFVRGGQVGQFQRDHLRKLYDAARKQPQPPATLSVPPC